MNNSTSKKTKVEFYEKEGEKLQNERDTAIKEIGSLIVKNIEHLREFHMQLITISLILIAAVIPITTIEGQFFFKNLSLTYTGVALLATTCVLTISYLNFIIVSENKHLTNSQNFYKRTFSEALDNLIEHVRKNREYNDYIESYFWLAQKNIKEEKEIRKISWLADHVGVISWFLVGLLIVGFFLIGASVFV